MDTFADPVDIDPGHCQ